MLYVRWTQPSGKLKFLQLIPEDSNEAPGESQADAAADGEGNVGAKRRKANNSTSKGALYHQYEWSVHRFLAHLRRVHPHLLPIMMDVNGNGVKVLVKAADPFADG